MEAWFPARTNPQRDPLPDLPRVILREMQTAWENGCEAFGGPESLKRGIDQLSDNLRAVRPQIGKSEADAEHAVMEAFAAHARFDGAHRVNPPSSPGQTIHLMLDVARCDLHSLALLRGLPCRAEALLALLHIRRAWRLYKEYERGGEGHELYIAAHVASKCRSKQSKSGSRPPGRPVNPTTKKRDEAIKRSIQAEYLPVLGDKQKSAAARASICNSHNIRATKFKALVKSAKAGHEVAPPSTNSKSGGRLPRD